MSCVQGCQSCVCHELVCLSLLQLQVFSELKFHDGKPMVGNYRPVQPLNGRLVYRSGGTVVLASVAAMLGSVAMALGLAQPN